MFSLFSKNGDCVIYIYKNILRNIRNVIKRKRLAKRNVLSIPD